MSLIKLKNVSKFYHNKNNVSSGFSKISLDIDIGEFVVITGESGSGKSTLLNVISGLDSYEEGEMYIDGEETSHYTEIDYENYRRKYIGNIFQNFNLINSYTVYQNVELVLLLNGYKKKEIKTKVLEIIKTVGLSKYKNTKSSKLSGGQKQRVAIARALAKDTPIIVADEPTGNLDVKSAKSIMKLLSEIAKNKLVVIVTHNYEQVMEYATRKISMNDGKIIEDKELSIPSRQEPELVQYKDLTNSNKIRLGFRNAFNIKTKFLLLFLVYFFLTMFVFSEYASLSDISFNESLIGSNEFFTDTSANRIILNKKDRTVFTSEEIDEITKMDNIKSIEKTDLILDLSVSAYNDEVYYYGKVKSLKEIDAVDYGKLPMGDSEIVMVVPEDSYYLYNLNLDKITQSLTLQNNNTGEEISKVTLTGIKTIAKNDDAYDADGTVTIYLAEELMEKLKIGIDLSYSTLEMTINDKTFTDKSTYFNILPNEHVNDKEAYVYNGLNVYCSYYNCLNKKINLSIENIYFKDNMDFTIKKVLEKNNFTNSTGLKDYEKYSTTIFISPTDYNNLMSKGNYQLSVFLDNLKNGEDTIKEFQDRNYNTYYMKDLLVNPTADLLGVVKIFRNVVFIIATIALFFISYFIIKIILKSRNIYFSTIRILGATKKVSKQLLNIELFIDISLAYLVFIGLVVLVKMELVNLQYIKNIVGLITFKDYIIVYIILATMSFLISNRFAHKLFKNSVMKTYREEV